MTDKKTEHTPRPCQCGGTTTRQSNRIPGWYRYGCQQCRRSGVEAETRALAIADWNLQTAGLDLLKALKDTSHILAKAVQQLNKDDRCSALVTACCQTSTDALIAIAKAEPKP